MPSLVCPLISGKTNNESVFFRYYRDLEALYQHVLNVHDSIVPVDSVYNVSDSSDIFRLIEVSPKPHTLTIMLYTKAL
jgi:hypothetical protein